MNHEWLATIWRSSRGHLRSVSSSTSSRVHSNAEPLPPLPPLCAAVNLLCFSSLLGWNVSECLGQTVPTRHSSSSGSSRSLSQFTRAEEDLESSGSSIVLLHLFDPSERLRWITARLNLSLLNIPTMTIQTGTRTTQSQPNHPKSECETHLRTL